MISNILHENISDYVLFLDNLSSHLSKEAMVQINKSKFVILFNASHCSELVSFLFKVNKKTSNFFRIVLNIKITR